jgi:hypothetical protein
VPQGTESDMFLRRTRREKQECPWVFESPPFRFVWEKACEAKVSEGDQFFLMVIHLEKRKYPAGYKLPFGYSNPSAAARNICYRQTYSPRSLNEVKKARN